MASVLLAVGTASSVDGTTFATGAFTPVLNDFLVVFVAATGTVAVTPTMTNSAGLTFKLIASQLYNAVDTMYVFVAQKLAAASSQTCTFTCAADAATGTVIAVCRVAGADNVSAYRQVKTASGAAGTAPTCVMPFAVNTKNATLGMAANEANPATLTPPTSWTESLDTGYTLPTAGAENAYRNSGETLTTIPWGGTSATAWGAAIVEVRTLVVPVAETILYKTAAETAVR